MRDRKGKKMRKIQIPKTESKVEDATLLKWYKKEGDRVDKGELIAETETFKAVVEIHSPDAGILYRIFVAEGETVPVNTVIAVIIQEGEKILPEDIEPFLQIQKEENSSAVNKEKKAPAPKDSLQPSHSKNETLKVAPIARKLALEKGIDLSFIDGSGPEGAITKKDIENVFSQKSKRREMKHFTVREVYQFTHVQKLTAERMKDSYKNIPQFTLCRKIDISSIIKRRKELNAQLEQHLSLIDFMIEALIPCFKKFPEFNAIIAENGYNLIEEVNINLAVMTGKGLMAPVLKDLEDKDILEIADLRKTITEQALKGKLQPEDFEQGTFTITNLGLQGIEYFTPIINPPQVAILGIGKSEGTSLPLSITMDHRIIDGAKGADFLEFLSQRLALHPEGGD